MLSLAIRQFSGVRFSSAASGLFLQASHLCLILNSRCIAFIHWSLLIFLQFVGIVFHVRLSRRSFCFSLVMFLDDTSFETNQFEVKFPK